MTRIVHLILLISLFGCASSENRNLSVRSVQLADFVASDNQIEPEEMFASDTSLQDQTETESTRSPVLSASSERIDSNRKLFRRGETYVVESVIGQVSGSPIFADDLLEPIADQLAREAERLNRREFVERAQQIVNSQLNEVVLEELFLAESEAALTTEEQQGLLSMLRELQERTLAQRAGVRARAETRLQEERGLTLDEFQELQRRGILINKLLEEKVEPRVIVSWKDVEREYERRKEEFHPPGTVTLMRLRLSSPEQDDLINQVKSRLADGESFQTVYESFGSLEASALDPLPMGPDGLSDIPVNEIYLPYLQGLDVGDTTDAIELENRTIWLHVADISQPNARSLYDVQRQLINELTIRRRHEERERYIRSLLERGVYDELDEMSQRLLFVAIDRYSR